MMMGNYYSFFARLKTAHFIKTFDFAQA